eukprot:TRINITY_DN21562_c0_g1_i1.p1 TRINITY_DN21562_c0_g1~~TRINITY_DN21562_c0_g1_i1.p1  ORF type:complete len:328 (-),score=54.61 TRINITY_DN21562_c0_g1_i1:55-1038(-)
MRFTHAVLAPCRRRAATCGLIGRIRRIITLSCRCCHRRRRKEKGAEDEDDGDIELGASGAPRSSEPPFPPLRGIGNGQDPDELGAASAHVPNWQMPKLVVECSQRAGTRVQKGMNLILPEAGAELLAGVVANLPVLLQIRPCWQLGYSMAVDGVSLRTMYRQVAEVGPCLLLVEDSKGCIFGAFLSEGLRPANQCYGTHECFVFRYPRAAGAWRAEVFGQASAGALPAGELPMEMGDGASGGAREAAEQYEALRKCQAWMIANSLSTGVVFCDHTGIVVGIDGPGLFIDQDLLRGVSWPSRAFGSPCLAANGPDFVVRNLEVWHWPP